VVLVELKGPEPCIYITHTIHGREFQAFPAKIIPCTICKCGVLGNPVVEVQPVLPAVRVTEFHNCATAKRAS
jgi:hypothetical protein